MDQRIDLNYNLPPSLEKILERFDWSINNTGCSKTDVFKLTNKEETLYLKVNKSDSIFNLESEKIILDWVKDQLPVPEVIFFNKFEGKEFLLISEIEGNVSYDAKSDEEKRSNIRILAESLKRMHTIDATNCPINNSPDKLIKIAKDRMEEGLVRNNEFDERWKNKSVEELFDEILKLKPNNYDLVFTHGDYCLPNIIIKHRKLSGFIDLIFAGMNDRYFDIAAVVWSIGYNFGSEWVKYFFEDYGLTDIDWERIRFFQMLNEFFQQ